MFRDKRIEILNRTDGHKDKYGIWHQGQLETVDSMLVTLQPITRKIVKRDFGLDIDVEYRVICDVNTNICDGSIIRYNNKLFKIEKLLPWESHYDFIIGDYDE